MRKWGTGALRMGQRLRTMIPSDIFGGGGGGDAPSEELFLIKQETGNRQAPKFQGLGKLDNFRTMNCCATRLYPDCFG